MKKNTADQKIISAAAPLAFRAAGFAFAAAILTFAASGCGGSFEDYDDKLFDFPEKAAPPVPNPIPYEPEAEQPPPPPPDADASPTPNSPNSGEAKPPQPPPPPSEEKSTAPKSRKLPPKDSGVQSIRVKGTGKDDSSAPPNESGVHPDASQNLDSSSEGPGRAKPGFEPPAKNVGSPKGFIPRSRFFHDEKRLQNKIDSIEKIHGSRAGKADRSQRKNSDGTAPQKRSSGLNSARDGD